MNDVDKIAKVLKSRFGHVTIRSDYVWVGKPALCVLDCVLSLNRNYDRVVFPRVRAFAEHRPNVTDLAQLQALLNMYNQIGDFCSKELNYNDVGREQTLRGVMDYLFMAQARHRGTTEWQRLVAWASSVRPIEYTSVGVRGFGLAGFQYLRMLFGVQTTKPDVHVIRFVSEILGRRVSSSAALELLEVAGAKESLPLREVDGAIWEAGARPQRTA